MKVRFYLMLAVLCMLTLFVCTSRADVFVITSNAIYQVSDAGSVKIADKEPGDKVVVDGVPNGPVDPTDPVDPDPSDPLEAMVRKSASLINEPIVSATIAAGYQRAADQMGEGKDWDQLLSAVTTFRGIAISRSDKKAQWTAMFVSMDSEMSKYPEAASTFQSIANGFKGAAEELNANPIEWFKLLECLPCIFDAFTSIEGSTAKPEPTPDKAVSIAKEEAAKITLRVPNGHIDPLNWKPLPISKSVLKKRIDRRRVK